MSYISSSIGPSPFLTSSHHHHFHSTTTHTSTHPHYTTNSYTNIPTYLAAYAPPAQVYQEKYFPKDMINVLPGVTNLQSQEQEKLIHPLNTYSGNVFSTHRINSPFNRGEIYLPNKSTMTSSYTDFSGSSLLDNKTAESYLQKKDNPFNKKYLLTQKNAQLQNYAHYFENSKQYQFSESVKQQRSKLSQRNDQKYLRQPTFSNDEIAKEVLELQSRPKININNRQDYRQQTYSKKQHRSQKSSSDRNPFQTHILGDKYQQDYLVESQVDQKQFGSFGQGKQGKQPYNSSSMDVPSYRSYENSKQNLKERRVEKNDQAESIIVGLSKFASNEQEKHEKSKSSKPKSKKQLVFIDSEDDQRRSGTFVVPNAIIDEINMTRVASNTIRKKDNNQSMYAYERQYEKQQLKYNKQESKYSKEETKYTKEEAIQVGKNPPNIITMRGKTYEKISL